MAKYFDRVAFTTATTGTGTMNVGSAVSAAFLLPDEAGAQNGDSSIPYLINDGNEFEIGYGTFSTGTPDTFSRDTVVISKVGGTVGTNKINLSGNAEVRFIADAAAFTESKEWTAETVSQAEAEAGTATTRRAWTAQRVKQAIDALASLDTDRIAKAWVNFNGTGTVSIRDDYNVSSITDNGTGDYTVNFSTAIGNANYAVAGAGRYDTGDSNAACPVVGVRRNSGSMASGSVRIISHIPTQTTGFDCDVVCLVVFGG